MIKRVTLKHPCDSPNMFRCNGCEILVVACLLSVFFLFCYRQTEPLPAFKVETVPCGSVSFQKVIFDPAVAATLPGLAGSEFIDAASKSDVVSGVYEGESLNVFLGYIFHAARRWAQDVGMHC
jgi:hypothetical protein